MAGREIAMTTGTEALVRRAYHSAEGDVLDVQAFVDLFAEDGLLNGIGCHIGVAAMSAQPGVVPDFSTAAEAPAPAR
jgi:hypothetical protein